MTFILNLILKHFDTILTVSVTVIGFIVSYNSTKKNFRNEIIKTKIATNTENIKEIPFELLGLMDKAIDSSSNRKLTKTYQDLMYKIVAYGSKDAIKIASCLQQSSFITEKKEIDVYKEMVLFSVLIS